MGNGKICDCCMEFTSLLQSYDGKRHQLNTIDDVNISKEEAETVILYLQSWTQRQCSCCFRDIKNFERFNWAIELLILVVIEILKNQSDNTTKDGLIRIDIQSASSSTISSQSHKITVWDIEDKEKLIHFLSKVFQTNFPKYAAFKQHIQMRTEEVTQQEIQFFSQFCEMNEADVSPYLFRNVALFCKNGGLSALQNFVRNQTPDTLPLHFMNVIVGLAVTIKQWLNFQTLLNFFVGFRTSVLNYLNKLVDTELKTTSARNMNEYIWSAVKDPVDAHLNFDRDGLDLAFKYFLSSTLTMRLSGITQITSHINVLNELITSDHIMDSDLLDQQLNSWLIEKQIVEHMFGPNLHVEVIKQSNTLLTYLAVVGKITKEHIDIIWGAAQLKHCSRTVYDVLSMLIGNLDPESVLHLRDLLWQLEPKDHTEASLFLTSNLTKFIWSQAALAAQAQTIQASSGDSTSQPLTSKFSLRRHDHQVATGESSSENSVSIGGSHSEDEALPLQIPHVLQPCNVDPNNAHPIFPVGKENSGSSLRKFNANGRCQVQNLELDSIEQQAESSDDEEEEEMEEDDEEEGSPCVKSEENSSTKLPPASSSNYGDSRSDSEDADAEKSGEESSPKKPKRRLIRRARNLGNVHKNLAKQPKQVDVGRELLKENSDKLEMIDPSVARVDELLEPNAVINELSNLVHMTENSPPPLMVQELHPNPSLIDNSDGGSYSSRMSTKSEKNMADFDGEESLCDEELMQSLTQNQLVELASRSPVEVRLSGLGPVFGPRPIRPFSNCRRRQFSTSGLNFQIENVCAPGQTILWDLIQDDKILYLPDGLANEAQKALTALLCYNSDKRIKLKFIEGCIENLARNSSIVVSLRLLPKLLASYPQPRTADTYQLTLWVDQEFSMRNKFFENLKVFKEQDSLKNSPFPYISHLQVRLDFLSVIFSSSTSPEDFRLSVDHINILWDCLATDPRSSDDFFVWMTGQVRHRDQHSLSAPILRHVFLNKLPSLPPETVTMHALTLFQQLCSIARNSNGEQDVEAAASNMDYLWKIALCANRTDVSMASINYLNGYYISQQLENEDEFIQRCMSHLAEATEELTTGKNQGGISDEAPLLRIQRALLLLKTHLETFRRKYAYHLRRWQLEGSGFSCHGQLVGEKGAMPLKIVINPPGNMDKCTLELQSTDYVAELRAELTYWWECNQSPITKEKNSATPVLGSLLTEGPLRIITQGIELSPEYDDKFLPEVPIKDMQHVYFSVGAVRGPNKKKESPEYSSLLPTPPRDKLPLTLLLQMKYFEQLFSLMQSLSSLKTPDRSGEAQPHTKGQVLSRRVWDILMLLPTNPAIREGIANCMEKSADEKNSFRTTLDPSSPQKLMYSLYIVEALVKIGLPNSTMSPKLEQNDEHVAWRHHFVAKGGLRHLFEIFASGVLEPGDGGDWSEWKQDCLASLLKILCFLGIMSEDADSFNEQFYHGTEISKRRMKRRKFSSERSPVSRLNESMLSMMHIEMTMSRLTNILQACSLPRDPNHYKTGFWGRSHVVHYAISLLVCWAFSQDEVKTALYSQKEFPQWLRRLVLEDPEPSVRREVCTGLYRLCLGMSSDGKTGNSYAPDLIHHLLQCLTTSLAMKPVQKQENSDVQGQIGYEDGKEPYGPACRDYFWLLGRLLDCMNDEFVKESFENPDNCAVDIDGLARTLSKAIITRDYYETRHNTVTDDALVGLLNTATVVMKHNPPFKYGKEGQEFLKQIFDCLFSLPSPKMRYLPKCKSLTSRSAAFDLLTELAKGSLQNYYLLQNYLMEQHQPTSHCPYGWDYWPHEDGRASCGYVGLTNLGATCYMASCMQHLYMMPQARASIIEAKMYSQSKHEQILKELQRMFAYLLESERKAYNPKSFCKVYQMDHQPLNTGEQKDMAEFFIDLVSKLEEMTPELQRLIKTLFCGVTSNNVVSLDCPHVSRTLEEFYTVRCQVSDMRTLYDSLNEVTVKDTLEGDNMYTCSQCGKKVRAEKRACFKKLPKILCFNTMRYTFNFNTMTKEKVNTHFSFPLRLDMSDYVEKTLMPQHYQEERLRRIAQKKEGKGFEEDGYNIEIEEEECLEYDLIGVTVHTGTADGGHYYSFIRDRVSPNKDKWYLFNDAEVKPFDPSQIAAECFGGEMNTKTYDSVTDKFMDFSFEKTNSAYMLFYERCSMNNTQLVIGGDGTLVPSLPGGSSQKQYSLSSSTPIPSVELNKELEDWIWQDNTQFLKDKNIFEHTYFNFMWQACGHIPQSLFSQEDVTLLAAKLSVTFFLETFIHAKEKPTMVQWVELITKQLSASQPAASWLLDHMGETDWWSVQILLKCSNHITRNMFHRLCIHVIQQVSRNRITPLFIKATPELINSIGIEEYSNFSCVTRFIKRLLSLLERGAKSHLKNLTEYFTLLYDFSKLGDDECLFLINMEAISAMVNFYLSLNKKDDMPEHGSEEEEEEEEIVCIPTEKNKVASLEKMVALVAVLVEKSRMGIEEPGIISLSPNDLNALRGTSGRTPNEHPFQFIIQQIRDNINLTSSRSLIWSLCRSDEKLAQEIISAIVTAIRKHPESSHPFFKILNLLAEYSTVMPVGTPLFTEMILRRILDVSEMCPYPTLEWLASQVPRNKAVQAWCLDSMCTWTEHFLISHGHQRVRNAAASLLVSLVPNQHFRQGYRTSKIYSVFHSRDLVTMSTEALSILQNIYIRLLNLLKPAKHYTDVATHGTMKLTSYFNVLTYFTISKAEKLLFGQYFMDLWNLFHPKLSEPAVSCHHNKQALLSFWHHTLVDCPENVQKILQNPSVTKHIGFNYILADHDDQEVVMYNKTMLPIYYSILRMCCMASRNFAVQLARHQNISWAFKNISPFPTQYPAAVDELLKLMQIFVTRPHDATEQEINDITVFKRSSLQLYLQILDGRSNWTTLISAFRILVETYEDRVFAVCNNAINLIFDALHSLHTMHHEATACHVTGEIVDLLNIIIEILRSFRPTELPHGAQVFNSDVHIQLVISKSKEWPEVLRKLATFLNTYNGTELRMAAIETLTEFLYAMTGDTLRTLVPLMIHCHSAYQDVQNAGMGPAIGPYFPKRMATASIGSLGLKSSVRPPRPMLQMAIPSFHRSYQGFDDGNCDEYISQLREFYEPYHKLLDLMCRFALAKDFMTPELAALSSITGVEAASVRFIYFPKLWLEVERKHWSVLVSCPSFSEYVELILSKERSSLTNELVYNFIRAVIPRVYDKIIGTQAMIKCVTLLVQDFRLFVAEYFNFTNTIEQTTKLFTDMRTLEIVYSPLSYGKPLQSTPVPSPAPSSSQVYKLCTLLLSFFNKLRHERDTVGGTFQSQNRSRRRFNQEGELSLDADILSLTITTTESLVRVLAPITTLVDAEEERNMETEDSECIQVIEGDEEEERSSTTSGCSSPQKKKFKKRTTL